MLRLVPNADGRLVERAEEIGNHHEAGQLTGERIAGVVGGGGRVDARLEGHRPVVLQGVGSVSRYVSSIESTGTKEGSGGGRASYRSVTNSSQ